MISSASMAVLGYNVAWLDDRLDGPEGDARGTSGLEVDQNSRVEVQ